MEVMGPIGVTKSVTAIETGIKTALPEALANRHNDSVEYVGFRVNGRAVGQNFSEHQQFSLAGVPLWSSTVWAADRGDLCEARF